MGENTKTKNQETLSEALAKIEELNGTIKTLQNELESANAKGKTAEQALLSEKSAHSKTKSELDALKSEKQDFDKAVAREAANIAAQNGVEVPPPAKSGPEEVLDENDIFEKINSAKGAEKAQLIEQNRDLIAARLRKGK